jgi:carboxylesterase
VLSGAEPFVHNGSDKIGVLLCHGFTGTPQSMRPWGEHLAAAGYSARCPRLPGHGTTVAEMNRTGWPQWYRCVSDELDELLNRCESVFVFGLSMGGTLTLRLAEERGADIAGIALVNASVTTLRRDAKLLPVLSKVVPSMPGVSGDIAKPGVEEVAYARMPLRAAHSLSQLWTLVRTDLPKIEQPMLLMRSAVDHIVEPVNESIIAEGVRSEDLTRMVLPDSYHVATLDYDAETIFHASTEFIHRISSGAAV